MRVTIILFYFKLKEICYNIRHKQIPYEFFLTIRNKLIVLVESERMYEIITVYTKFYALLMFT